MNRVTANKATLSRGSTLIELMVAILIGLVMVVAAFSVLASFEGNKRTTTAMGDALQSGNFGIYELDKLVRSAGTGIAQYGGIAGYGGPLNFVPTTGAAATNGAVTLPAPFDTMLGSAGVTSVGLAPAVIFPDAGASGNLKSGTDAIMFMLGGGGYGEVGVPITPSAASGGALTVDSTVGMSTGEWILLGTAGIGNCMISKVGAGFLGTTNGNVIVPIAPATIGSVTANSFVNGYAVPLGQGTAANFSVFGVGQDDALYTVDMLNNLATAQEVTDDIVVMRAVYGVSATPGGNITWVKPAISGGNNYTPQSLMSGTAAANTLLHMIRAIRIGMIVRAPLAEKSSGPGLDANGNPFNKTTPFTIFSSLTPAAQYVWTVPADQQNYRYRLIEATIPIRNGFF